MDTRSAEQRRHIMQSVKSKDTRPELMVRQLLHSMGFRYRLHRKDLPGKPDIAFGPMKKVIFVHGCFWHGHECSKGRLPKSKLDYWEPKIAANKERDERKKAELEALGWRVLEVWQCEMVDVEILRARLCKFLHN